MTLSQKLYDNAGIVFPAVSSILLLAFSGMLDPYLAFVATSWLIFGLLGLSLDIVWGRSGFLSLGQTAFYGLGGYFGGVVAINLAPSVGNTLLIALPAGAVFGAVIAFALGYIIFYARMGELQSTILSYTFTVLLWVVTQTFRLDVGNASIGGDNGLVDIPGIVLGFGADAQSVDPNEAFATVLILVTILYFITRTLMRSTFGKVIDCVRMDSDKTELIGYDTRKYQVINFAYAGALAGLAGALFGLWANYLNPSIFSVQEALLVPIYVLVGGLGTLTGGFAGALLIGGLSFFLGSGAVGGQTTLILGTVLIILVLFLKNGILGALGAFWRKYLPDPNDAARNTKAVKIDTNILKSILEQTMDDGTKTLATKDLFKQFGGVIPVNTVSQEFQIGTPHSIIGPNGAGKSSFLKTCIGMYKPEAGTVMLNGLDMTHTEIFAKVHEGIVIKNQKPQVFGDLSVGENLWIAAYSRYKNIQKADDIRDKILGMLGMDRQIRVQASALSHGQQQWLDIGMVLCLAPRVILLDEPAAGMTIEETRELSNLVRLLTNYVTVIVVEHDMEFVRTLQGHVTVLHQGEVFAEGDIETLRADDRVLDIYLGRRHHV